MPPATTAAPETPKAAPKPPLDVTKPLSAQVNQIIKLADEKAAKAGDEPAKKSEEAPKDNKPAGEPAPPEVPSSPAEELEEEQPEQKPVELAPLQKFVLEKLPTLTTRLKVGDKIKIVQFKDVNELPDGFELADDSTRAQFTVDVAAQVGRAKDAIAEYRNIELSNKVREYEAQEAKEVAADLERLQKRGILPKFQYKEDDPRFNDDEGVKLANKVYKLFKDTNEAYRKANKTYRITYEDAADKYFAREARTAANESQKGKEQPKTEKHAPTQAQKEREQIARQTGAPSGGEPQDKRPVVRSGMRMDDINRLVRMGRI